MLVFSLKPSESEKILGLDYEAVVVDDVPCDAVVLLGYFDGVHRGHGELIDEALALAGDSRDVVVWTPEAVPKASAERGLLNTRAEKLRLFGSFSADYAVLDSFEDIRSMDGESFFRSLIVERFRPYAVVCGENFRFGRGASCTFRDLKAFAQNEGIICRVVSLLRENDVPISSTEIRNLILNGKIGEANRLLGYSYSITSRVIHGIALGRTIGYPTINQVLPREKIIPKNGVYACTVSIEDGGCISTWVGVCNIGSRPTVNSDENDITFETYIIGFSGDLYGKTVKTSLLGRIRGEKAFSSVDELSEQIQNDARVAKEIADKIALL